MKGENMQKCSGNQTKGVIKRLFIRLQVRKHFNDCKDIVKCTLQICIAKIGL